MWLVFSSECSAKLDGVLMKNAHSGSVDDVAIKGRTVERPRLL